MVGGWVGGLVGGPRRGCATHLLCSFFHSCHLDLLLCAGGGARDAFVGMRLGERVAIMPHIADRRVNGGTDVPCVVGWTASSGGAPAGPTAGKECGARWAVVRGKRPPPPPGMGW